jgi:hypothetical protein
MTWWGWVTTAAKRIDIQTAAAHIAGIDIELRWLAALHNISVDFLHTLLVKILMLTK